MSLNNAFTIDVEDYYQVEAFSKLVNRSDWNQFESRVENNTNVVLDILDDYSVKGTFFILGCVAKDNPRIVEEISSRGHEVASHGMTHKLIYTQSIEEFKTETLDSKAILEDICQQNVIGYRAATYSITRESLWALDIIAESGFKYDSSIFPMHHDRYGIPDAEPLPHILKTPAGYNLIEFPISTVKTRFMTFPVAGGGYFRLFPYFVTRLGLRSINHHGHEFLFYLHPWEFDPNQPVIQNAGLLTKFRHYVNIAKTGHKVKKLLNDFNFTTMRDVLENQKLLHKGEILQE